MNRSRVTRFLGRHFGRQDPSVIPGLEALRQEFPDQGDVVDGYLIYATVGLDRRLLGREWVEKCRAECEKQRDFLSRFR